MSDDRAEMQAARLAGLQKRHEQRLENATYTAAEVKVLTEAALRLGRKEAGEEIAGLIEGIQTGGSWQDFTLGFDEARSRAASIARSVAASAPPDATSGRTDPGMDSDLPQDSQAVSKRIPVHKPFPDDGVLYCGWSTGAEVIEGCGEVWPCSDVRNHRNPNREDA